MSSRNFEARTKMLETIMYLLMLLLILFLKKIFLVPSKFSHLPRAPVLPLLWSYLSAEAEDLRIKRIILPFANDHGHPIVLVWAFGMWIVHVLDFKVMIYFWNHHLMLLNARLSLGR